MLVGLPFLLKSSWLWLYKCSDDDERHECCCYHDGDECAVHRPVVPVFVFFHNEKLLSSFAIHPPGGRKEKAREDLVFQNEDSDFIRWIVETFGDGLRHTLLAPPDYYAKQQREAEQRLATPRFSRPCSHKPQVTAGGLRPPRFTSHSALCFSFRLELRLHVTAVLATGRLPYL